MQSHALSYWNGKEYIKTGFGWVDGLPFVVEASDGHWIPVNHLVFAKDADEAIKIIRDALVEISEKSHGAFYGEISRQEHINKLFALTWSAKPYDKTLVSHVQWAANDQLVN
jgi:hypothetical protein